MNPHNQTIRLDDIAPEKTNILGKTGRRELHPVEKAAFTYCLKHGIDRKGWAELVKLIENGQQMQRDWEQNKVNTGRTTDVIAYRLREALQEHE